MGITFYHNPKCSKSREAMALLEKCGEKFRVVEYLREPLKEAELLLLFEILDGPISAVVRHKEEKYKELQFDLGSKQAIAKNLALHPELLERPIVVKGKLAVIARPIENLEKIF